MEFSARQVDQEYRFFNSAPMGHATLSYQNALDVFNRRFNLQPLHKQTVIRAQQCLKPALHVRLAFEQTAGIFPDVLIEARDIRRGRGGKAVAGKKRDRCDSEKSSCHVEVRIPERHQTWIGVGYSFTNTT